ncbi:MAG: L-ribulose-5-phosphate 4-epimerase AraD [Oscillospiraceae bacterium]|nr:L-ribulose-5-phosphate 4-epimerase AraD [Oscillospiraceae bacterium]
MDELKARVLAANLALPALGLVSFTWGNVSGIDRERGLVVIKPSGVAYESMTAADLVVVDLDGRTVEGSRRPSSDTATHLELYRAFPSVGGVVHTHSRWATIFAQAGRAVPALGTTHADEFCGPVPCTRPLTDDEIAGAYEKNTGLVIAETVSAAAAGAVPAVLVQSHGPFAWGPTPEAAVHSAAVLEEVADMAWHTLVLSPETPPVPAALLDRHYRRKHGKDAYYGQ